MINPSELNLSTLPFVSLTDRLRLPSTPCIYFAIDSLENIQYIGRSINPKLRWSQHRQYKRLNAIGGVRIAYLLIELPELLPEIEIALIEWFKPPLNVVGLNLRPAVKVANAGLMKVKKVIEQECPGLGTRIKDAREADKRSLAELCRQVDMTPMNWYKIEAEETKSLPLETLRKIESVLGVDFGVQFND